VVQLPDAVEDRAADLPLLEFLLPSLLKLKEIPCPVALKESARTKTPHFVLLGACHPMNVTIVDYNDPAHRNQVIALWESVFGYETAHNRPALAIDKKLAVNDSLFFVAIANDKVIGTIMAGYDGHRGWIYSVAVSTSHRRRRIGSRLVSHAERALTARGCVKINLQILERNESVCAFYSSLGFSIEKRISMAKRIPQNIPPA
jgi:ribosomal protein S18 acetylase RimI-like enzyme